MEYSITLNEGTDFSMTFYLYKEEVVKEVLPTGQEVSKVKETVLDLTDCKVKGQVRKEFGDTSPALLTFRTDIVDNEITLRLTKQQLSNLVTHKTTLRNSRLGFYDVVLMDKEGIITRIMQGEVMFSRKAAL